MLSVRLSELGATSPFPIDERVIDTMNEARVNTVRTSGGQREVGRLMQLAVRPGPDAPKCFHIWRFWGTIRCSPPQTLPRATKQELLTRMSSLAFLVTELQVFSRVLRLVL